MITAQDVKNAIVWERRIFFVSEYSEIEEERWVINYAKTAEKLNDLIKIQSSSRDNYKEANISTFRVTREF